MLASFDNRCRTIIEIVFYGLYPCARRRAFILVRPTGPASSIIGAFNV